MLDARREAQDRESHDLEEQRRVLEQYQAMAHVQDLNAQYPHGGEGGGDVGTSASVAAAEAAFCLVADAALELAKK